jgi:hypothetical protein
MSSVTFDGVALVRPSFPQFDREPLTTVTVLASGKRSVSGSDELGFEVTFTCYTDSLSDISNLRAKIGSPYTLVIDSTSYTNCYIKAPWKERKLDNNNWQYTVSFVRDTTS